MTKRLAVRDAAEGAMRFTVSALTQDSSLSPGPEFERWWADRAAAGRFRVDPITFDALDKWGFQDPDGSLAHTSGRFFVVEGLRVTDGTRQWDQPIINQPEIGVLGILVKEFDGVLHCLMQAKMEPGNVNTLQLSPTVQATRSNYSKVHRGAGTRYLEHFRGPTRGRVLVDVLQSEQGAWFWHKSNRNMVVQALTDVEVHEDFRWLTLHQVRALLRQDNMVNMDARTVLSCIPFAAPHEFTSTDGNPFVRSLVRSYTGDSSLHSDEEILSWFIESKARCDWSSRLIPLHGIKGWHRTDHEIADEAGRLARVIAVSVQAGNREVHRWTQPLLAPRGHGLAAFLVRRIGGVLHVLVQSRGEPGLLDLVEMAPTVQLVNAQDPVARAATRFCDHVLHAAPETVRFDAMLSEEGGRFHHAQTRYRVVEAGSEFPLDVPEEFCWVTVRQMMELLRHGHYLNIEARSLLACLHSLW
ncbi:oxidase EvaA [Crossiella equi]|uniref:Oxidase EvaA n=1 Tax=Crossiella equi TaxID=130796 RepID=A0ABS5AA95_9PSEU|nr:NDP-hexose 2,3-dehydratase family protein [Crossiella equi]MBP2473504.1 oxidase EvaA [Crossiella equi]